jgi:hypothetical protein
MERQGEESLMNPYHITYITDGGTRLCLYTSLVSVEIHSYLLLPSIFQGFLIYVIMHTVCVLPSVQSSPTWQAKQAMKIFV